MATVQSVMDALEQVAPTKFAFDWDKIGLQVGRRDQEIVHAVVALDRSMGAINFAIEQNAQLLLTHHPLIWDPIASVTSDTAEGRAIQRLIQHDIALIAAHTNWDVAPGGINDTLADRLGLKDVLPFGIAADIRQTKLVTFAPETYVDRIVDACASAGAGMIGNYRRCAFISPGTGTFEAMEGSQPTVGKVGVPSKVEEMRIEMVCPAGSLPGVIQALRTAHPYEEVAFDIVPLHPGNGYPAGRIGILEASQSLAEFVSHVDHRLSTRSLAWGTPSKSISKVAVVGGAADSEWQSALASGADVLVTGEVRQHIAVEASAAGISIISAGHYATEHPGCVALAHAMSGTLTDVDWIVYEPSAGEHGRPL